MSIRPRLAILAVALCVIACDGGGTIVTAASPATAQTVTVNIDTTNTITVPSRANFAGANMMIMNTGTSYKDTAMQTMVQTMHLGWARFPGGTNDDAWDQSTGTMNPSWVSEFSSYTSTYNALNGEMKTDGGKQDKNSIANFASFLSSQTNGSTPTHFIGVVNVFTDTSAHAATLVSSAQSAGLTGLDDLWELGNETSYFSTFFGSGTAYLNAVKPYATAITGVETNARFAVWVDLNNSGWMTKVTTYSNPFWQQLYTHQYPTPPDYLSDGVTKVNTASQFVAFYNEFLLDKTNTFFDSLPTTYTSLPSSYQMEVSEYNIAANDWLNLKSTAYNAVFVAEYLLRTAIDPHITHAGMHLAVSNSSAAQEAVVPTNDYISQCQTAYASGTTIDTANATLYPFGYSMAAPGMALELVDQAINTSTAIWPTSVSGGTWVSFNNYNGTSGTMPAVYAQAVKHSTNPQHLLLTNKSGVAQTVTIEVNGMPLSTSYTTSYITATAPDTVSGISIQTGGSATGPVTLPPYSVMNVAWSN
jgi:hypothetical protein